MAASFDRGDVLADRFCGSGERYTHTYPYVYTIAQSGLPFRTASTQRMPHTLSRTSSKQNRRTRFPRKRGGFFLSPWRGSRTRLGERRRAR
ncbi:hypothetical protein CDEST_13235 [Colletotrichum destructivum]|uniref:Uncharacterized protein n=1 Tax=Colletotrichum destructivum TaxID=34406 RepID=A0AAX4IYS5_9PEZI|nr:hypothetical protein CDEST_13235 [Colletotrichum destructivum]